MLVCVDTDGQRWWDVLSVGRREFGDDAVFQWSHRWCYESRPLTIRVRKYLCFWGNLCVCFEFVSSWHKHKKVTNHSCFVSLLFTVYCASPTAHHFQALHSCLQVPPRHSLAIHDIAPPTTIPVGVWCADIIASQSSTAALFFDEFTSRATHSHILRRQEHRCSQTGSMECSTSWTHWLQSVAVSF